MDRKTSLRKRGAPSYTRNMAIWEQFRKAKWRKPSEPVPPDKQHDPTYSRHKEEPVQCDAKELSLYRNTMTQPAEGVLEKPSVTEYCDPCSGSAENGPDLQQKTISKVPADTLAQEPQIDQLCSEDLATAISNHSIFTQIHSILINGVHNSVIEQIFCEVISEYGQCLRRSQRNDETFMGDVRRTLNNLKRGDSDWHWTKVYELYRRHRGLQSDLRKFVKICNQNDYPYPMNINEPRRKENYFTTSSVNNMKNIARKLVHEAKCDERFTLYKTISVFLFRECIKFMIETILKKTTGKLSLEDAVRIYYHCRSPNDNIELRLKCETVMAEIVRKDTSASELIGQLDLCQNYKVTIASSFFEIIKLRERDIVRHMMNKYRNVSFVHINLLLYEIRVDLTRRIVCKKTRSWLPWQLLEAFSGNAQMDRYCNFFERIIQTKPQQNETSQSSDAIHKEHSGTESSVLCSPQSKMDQEIQVKSTPGAKVSALVETSASPSAVPAFAAGIPPPTQSRASRRLKQNVHGLLKKKLDVVFDKMIKTHKDEIGLEVEQQRDVNLEHAARTDDMEIDTMRHSHKNTDEPVRENMEDDICRKSERIVHDEGIKNGISPSFNLTEEKNANEQSIDLKECEFTNIKSKRMALDDETKEIKLENESVDMMSELIDPGDEINKREESLKMSVKEIIDEYLQTILPEMEKRVISSIREYQQKKKTAFRLVKLTARTIMPDLTKLLEVLKKYKPVSIKMHNLMLTSLFVDTQEWRQLTDVRNITIDGKTVDVSLAAETLDSDHNLMSITPEALRLYQTIHNNNNETTIKSYTLVENINNVSSEDRNQENLLNVSHEEDNTKDRPLTKNNKDKNLENVETVTKNNEYRNQENLLNVSHQEDNAKDKPLSKNNKDKNIENVETVTQNNEDRNQENLLNLSHEEDNAKDRPLSKNNKDKNFENVETVTQNNEDRNQENLQNLSHEEDNAKDRPLSKNNKDKNFENVETVTKNYEDRNQENLLNRSHEVDRVRDRPLTKSNNGKNLENRSNVFQEEDQADEEPLTNEVEYGNIENTSDDTHEDDFDNLMNSFDIELGDLFSTIKDSEDFDME